MEFRIAVTFTDALARLTAQEQKAVKTTAFDLQLDPSAPGLSFHRIDRSKDPNFWSLRVSRDLRMIVHRTAASLLLAYVDHHDRAYGWAERRRIEAHPRTGAVQIVEVRERVEGVAVAAAAAPAPLFAKLTTDRLLSVGVPADWTADVLAADEDRFLALVEHLPQEAAEALLGYVGTGVLQCTAEAPAAVRFEHPDAQRRFRTVDSLDELKAALDHPWERWTVFLHPSQRALVERSHAGPARVAGSAGTGKTVVALHRAVRLARAAPAARVLLTTFSEQLAAALRRKLTILAGGDGDLLARITVASFHGIAAELYARAGGSRPRMAGEEEVRAALAEAAASLPPTGFSPRFLLSELTHVVDAWQLADAAAYAAVPRLGRKNRMGSRQRERLWPVLAAARRLLAERGLLTWPQLLAAVAERHAGGDDPPFAHIVVDEAQDLGVPELRLLAAIAPAVPEALFFAGDLGQRIFQQPFSWKALGVDVRGRSTVLKVNYRTSHQIRAAADRLMPKLVRDVDGLEEDRRGVVSVLDGPRPEVVTFANQAEEIEQVGRFIRAAVAAGTAAQEIALFVRTEAELGRARAAAAAAGHPVHELRAGAGLPAGQVAVGLMHLAKGLEFKAVAVMACDDGVLPLQPRVEAVADEAELDEVFETERQLLYVACTRARDRLLVSGVAPGSEFLADLREM